MKLYGTHLALCVGLFLASISVEAKPILPQNPAPRLSYVLSLERVNRRPNNFMWVLRHGASSIAATSLRDRRLRDYINLIQRGSSITLIEAGEYSRETMVGEEEIMQICKKKGIFFGGFIT